MGRGDIKPPVKAWWLRWWEVFWWWPLAAVYLIVAVAVLWIVLWQRGQP